MAKRARGEGSIRQRQDKRWEARVDLGRGPDGKRRRKSAFAPTQGEAVKLLKRLAGRQVDGQLLTTSTPTVSSYLEDWFANEHRHVAAERAPGIPSRNRWIPGPGLRALRLEQLTPQAIQRWLTDHKVGSRGTSPNHTRARHTPIGPQRRAAPAARVTINAATLVKVPRVTTRDTHRSTIDQARAFLVTAGSTPARRFVLRRAGVRAPARRGHRPTLG